MRSHRIGSLFTAVALGSCTGSGYLVPEFDSATGPEDAQGPGDAGTLRDSGSPPRDAGSMPDSGPTVDASEPDVDAGTSAALRIDTATLPSAKVGAAYATRLEASGGSAPYTWTLGASGLPEGLALDASAARIAGTPTRAGAVEVSVTVEDSGQPRQSATRSFTMAVADDTPIPVGTDGLLTGMTPASYTLPAGWSLVRTQDFESGCPSEEWCGRYSGSITATRPHTGASSIEGTYAADQSDVGWTLDEGHVGAFSEVYLSFYEFIEPQALFNDEFFLAHFIKHVGDSFQEVVLDWFWPDHFNWPAASLYVVGQGQSAIGASEYRRGPTTDTVPKGEWVQWEIHYRPNSPGNSDGLYRLYLNGVVFLEAANEDLNGAVNMSNMVVQVGGVYTKLVWMTDSPTCSKCSSAPGQGTDYCTASQGWWGQSFSDPVCNPTDPPLPSFKRFFDDIIVLKR